MSNKFITKTKLKALVSPTIFPQRWIRFSARTRPSRTRPHLRARVDFRKRWTNKEECKFILLSRYSSIEHTSSRRRWFVVNCYLQETTQILHGNINNFYTICKQNQFVETICGLWICKSLINNIFDNSLSNYFKFYIYVKFSTKAFFCSTKNSPVSLG